MLLVTLTTDYSSSTGNVVDVKELFYLDRFLLHWLGLTCTFPFKPPL